MRKNYIGGVLFVFITFFSANVMAQEKGKEIFFYKKAEQNTGILFSGSKNREEFITDKSRRFEELTTGLTQFYYNRQYWNYLDFKQEKFQINTGLGPIIGNGNWLDSSRVEVIDANHRILGVRANASIAYTSRYYWDRNNYTIIDVNAWGKYDLLNVKSDGTRIDSMAASFPYHEEEKAKKLRYGFQAKAGWGIGRLNPMNNYMIADYLLNKYYKGRNFSEAELIQVADEIGRIKADRAVTKEHDIHEETKQIENFIRKKLFLELPENLQNEWQYGEFLPRFNGRRVEAGPFFEYFNREPDFVYGAYVKVENVKYKSHTWNRNFCANLSYNGYKRKDWILAEFDLGWSYYPNLKSQWDFGINYKPGLVVNGLDDIGTLKHALIPYVAWFTQMTSKTRLQLDASLRIADDDQFVLAGPEFSVKLFRSNY